MTEVLITASFPDALLDKIKAVSPDLTVTQRPLPGQTWPESWQTEAEIVYVTWDAPPPAAAPNLRWVQAHFAGVNHLRKKPIWESDVLLTSASGIHAPNIAQYIFAQLLAWTHKVPTWIKTKQKGEWPQQRWQKFVPTELRGHTLGILGYGSIGRETARLAKAFGMKVLVTKRDAMQPKDMGYVAPGSGDPAGDLPDRIYPTQATRTMLPLCDFVVIALPSTPETVHFIDEAALKEMKPSAFLINVGRGNIIDETALIKALRKGWIAGAGLDVFETEPLPTDSPLWQLENVILTPHVSGFTPHYDERATDLFAENLRRYLAGERLLNVVQRELGY